MTIGRTPNAVVQEVRKIGFIRRAPASIAAVLTSRPFENLSSSAYSYITIPLRTMMPIRLTMPRTAVRPKSRLKIQSPKKAPNRHRRLITRVNNERESFLKWNSIHSSRISTAAAKDQAISGPSLRLAAVSPPYSTTVPSGRPGMISFSTYSFICFIAAGWLLPYFISAKMLTLSSPDLRSSWRLLHSGSIEAICLSGTLMPGTAVDTIREPIDWKSISAPTPSVYRVTARSLSSSQIVPRLCPL